MASVKIAMKKSVLRNDVMTDEQKVEYLDNIKYFWNEKGEIERFCDYSPEKLYEASPIIARAYSEYKIAKQTLSILLNYSGE